MLTSAIPLLHVHDAAAARDFYCGGLGFAVQFANPEGAAGPAYVGVARDGVVLHLSSHADDGVPGTAVLLRVDDMDAMHAELASRGVPIALLPTDQAWGLREMYVRDPDGNALRFACPIAG